MNNSTQHYQQRIELALQKHLPKPDTQLTEAMRYSVLNGGKRLRPILVYATGQCFNTPLEQLDKPAMAVELIHCYSLVHDDLPAMDDDDLRRGQPTCHKKFNEATAILVGDALQSLAFELLETPQQIQTLAKASGYAGMAGGQALDLQAENKTISLEALKTIHQLKTGALIRASVQLGAVASGCDDPTLLNQLDHFANQIGLAFQVQDDLLDLEGDTALIGKQTGADVALNKATFPSLLGLSKTKRYLQTLHTDALQTLQAIPFATSELESLAGFIIQRQS